MRDQVCCAYPKSRGRIDSVAFSHTLRSWNQYDSPIWLWKMTEHFDDMRRRRAYMAK